MKKLLKGLLITLLILSVLVGALMVWQWDNLKMVMMSIRHTEEDIDTLVTDNEGKIDEILNSLTGSTLRALTEEERKKLLSGELTEEEAKEIIKVEETEETKSNVDDILARIYILRAEYVNRISELEKEAKDVGKKAIKEKLSLAEKLKLVDQYLAKGNALEKECDAKMDVLILELEAELKRLGEDTSIISEVRSVYDAEKKLKKSQLLAKYKKYLK